MARHRRRFTPLAFLLWFVIGTAGAHRLYLGRYRSGLAIFAYSAVTSALDYFWFDLELPANAQDPVYWGTLIALFAFLLLDAFKLPSWVDSWNARIRLDSTFR